MRRKVYPPILLTAAVISSALLTGGCSGGGKSPAADVDLTALSSTMVYAEVYNMIFEPAGYVGKTVKMEGMFTRYEDTEGNAWNSCVIMDATACCSQGLEFVLTDEYVYPDDYPEEGDDITVLGTFDTYKEDGYEFVTIRDAELL